MPLYRTMIEFEAPSMADANDIAEAAREEVEVITRVWSSTTEYCVPQEPT